MILHQCLSPKLPRLYCYNEQTKILSQLVDQIQTITLQDSLQTIDKMNTADLYAMIDKLIEEYDKNKKE